MTKIEKSSHRNQGSQQAVSSASPRKRCTEHSSVQLYSSVYNFILRKQNIYCSSRIKLWTQSYLFTRKTGFFGRDKVTDWQRSHFCQHFLTKNKVADSNSV